MDYGDSVGDDGYKSASTVLTYAKVTMKALKGFRLLLSGGVGTLEIVHIVSLGCGIAATVVWTRMMPQETLRQFKVVMAFLGVFIAFCLL